jgi:DUF1707 SHOCT-like domain
MSTEPTRMRASDPEREEFATIVREATAEGRLSLAEGDERLAQIYAAKFRDELRPLVADLPAGQAATPAQTGPQPGWPARTQDWRPPRGLFIRHAAVVTAISAVLVGLWVLSGAHFFWPAIPLFFLALGLARHARWAGRGWDRRWDRRWDRGTYR